MAASLTSLSLSARKRTRADKWVWLSRRASRFSSWMESCLRRLTIAVAILMCVRKKKRKEKEKKKGRSPKGKEKRGKGEGGESREGEVVVVGSNESEQDLKKETSSKLDDVIFSVQKDPIFCFERECGKFKKKKKTSRFFRVSHGFLFRSRGKGSFLSCVIEARKSFFSNTFLKEN